MGRDKAVLQVENERLIDRAVDALAPLGGHVVVARGSRPEIPGLRARQLPDRLRDAGPLAGIEAGLRAGSTPLVAVVAVDTARVSADLLLELAARWDGSSVAVVPVVDGRLQPLHACWSSGALDDVTAALDGGERSPTRFLEQHQAQRVGDEVWSEHDADAAFARSFNRPADLGGSPSGQSPTGPGGA